jgi:hypothetical protein
MNPARMQALILGCPAVPGETTGEAIAFAVAADGTVSAATPLGTLVVELSGTAAGHPEVITSIQPDLRTTPRELGRYPLRNFLALFLRRMRAAGRRRPMKALRLGAGLPWQLQGAQRLALAQFMRINFDALVLIAHVCTGRHMVRLAGT